MTVVRTRFEVTFPGHSGEGLSVRVWAHGFSDAAEVAVRHLRAQSPLLAPLMGHPQRVDVVLDRDGEPLTEVP